MTKTLVELDKVLDIAMQYCPDDDEFDATPLCPNCGAIMDLKDGESE